MSFVIGIILCPRDFLFRFIFAEILLVSWISVPGCINSERFLALISLTTDSSSNLIFLSSGTLKFFGGWEPKQTNKQK